MGTNAWHEHCILRDDVRQGTLELAEFAADLYAVRTGAAPNVYRIPNLFFDRTYPTYNLKTLARDVLRRLAGQGGNPVITVQVAYGGGKTHALIALLHLAERGAEFQTHDTVREFVASSGLDTLPQARVAILPFDKFDAKNGLSVIGPDGQHRQVKTPWGALAYQLAGDKGLAIVAEHETDYINPSEHTLVDLLKIPQSEGLSTLILLDEALMYTRAAVNDDPKRFGILQDFFQSLTQAVNKVSTAAIVASLITADIDAMSVQQGLSDWRNASWFLKENDGSWALGTTPNLTNMHVRAMDRLAPEDIDEDLVWWMKDATLGRNTDGVAVHTLPQSTADISDNPELHYIIAGPEHAAVPGEEISPELKTFFERTYRNNIIILAPENSLLTGLRQRIRKILGWQNIESGDDMNLLNGTQKALLLQRKQEDDTGILESGTAAYSVLIAVDEEGDIKASTLLPGTDQPFQRVKTALIAEDRLLTDSLDPELLTPDSYFDIWGEDETAKPVQGLYRMFASLSRLPRLLNRQVFIDTLRRGLKEGQIVLRIVRPDGSQNTYWRDASITDEDIWKKELEIVPIEHAELHNISAELLAPGKLPELWQGDDVPTTIGAIREFFNGDEAPKLASDNVLSKAIQSAVQNELLMARHKDKAYFKEAIPDAEITDELELLAPLEPISGSELSHKVLPDAWDNETSSVGKIIHALTVFKGTPIPWQLIVDAINDARDKRLFEFIEGSLPWPCAAEEADKVGLKVSQALVEIAPTDLIGTDAKAAWESGNPTLGLIKETLETNIGVTIPDHVFLEAAKGAISDGLIVLLGSLNNDFYHVPVKQAGWIQHIESLLTETEIQDLAETVIDLADIAPELDFQFRITITAEGEPPSNEVLEKINEALQKVTDKLKFD